MKNLTFRYIVGQPILNPNNFFGRVEQVDRFFNIINGDKSWAHQLIIGLRTAGKTSYLKYISNKTVIEQRIDPNTPRTSIVYIDMEKGVNTPEDFYNTVWQGIAKKLPINIAHLNTKTSHSHFEKFYDRIEEAVKLSRIVILLDEFDILIKSEKFDINFFRTLRSLICEFGERLILLVALNKSFEHLSEKIFIEDKTSYFFGVFYHLPIYLSQMTDDEARQVISKPAKSENIIFQEREIQKIIQLSGKLPFLLQAVSERWLSATKSKTSHDDIIKTVISDLIEQDNAISHTFSRFWRNFSNTEKEIMSLGVLKRLQHSNRIRELSRLANHGLIRRKFDNYEISSSLLENWINNFNKKVDPVPSKLANGMCVKIIRIFLASSSELREDRDAFELYFRQQNDRLRKEGLYIEIVRWENYLDAMSNTRLQDKYNQEIRNCDIFVSLFKTKTGKYTEEEFNVAIQTYKKTGKPQIYTYFQKAMVSTSVSNRADVQSLWDFQKKLEKLGHFYTEYESIDGLQRHFRDQLDMLRENDLL